MRKFLVFYNCTRTPGIPVIRAVEALGQLDAAIVARMQEREETTTNCPDCKLVTVREA